MNLIAEVEEIDKLYEAYSGGEMETIAEVDLMEERIDKIRDQMIPMIKAMPIDKLRDFVASEDWIITESLEEQNPDDEIFREEACDAMYEDFDYVLHAWKAMLGMIIE